MLHDKCSKINDIEMSSLFQPVYELIEFHKTNLNTNFLREDYHELVQLCLLYLGIDYSVKQFRKPGNISRARLMSKILYSLKFVLLSTQIIIIEVYCQTKDLGIKT